MIERPDSRRNESVVPGLPPFIKERNVVIEDPSSDEIRETRVYVRTNYHKVSVISTTMWKFRAIPAELIAIRSLPKVGSY